MRRSPRPLMLCAVAVIAGAGASAQPFSDRVSFQQAAGPGVVVEEFELVPISEDANGEGYGALGNGDAVGALTLESLTVLTDRDLYRPDPAAGGSVRAVGTLLVIQENIRSRRIEPGGNGDGTDPAAEDSFLVSFDAPVRAAGLDVYNNTFSSGESVEFLSGAAVLHSASLANVTFEAFYGYVAAPAEPGITAIRVTEAVGDDDIGFDGVTYSREDPPAAPLVTLYADRAAFETAIGPGLQNEDFEGLALDPSGFGSLSDGDPVGRVSLESSTLHADRDLSHPVPTSVEGFGTFLAFDDAGDTVILPGGSGAGTEASPENNDDFEIVFARGAAAAGVEIIGNRLTDPGELIEFLSGDLVLATASLPVVASETDGAFVGASLDPGLPLITAIRVREGPEFDDDDDDDIRFDDVVFLPGPSGGGGASVAVGDVYVADRTTDALLRVLAGTGSQSTLASGAPFYAPRRIAEEPSGMLLLADAGRGGRGAVLRVDPISGRVVAVSEGGELVDPRGIAVSDAGEIYVSDVGSAGAGKIVRVHPGSGAQTVVSSGGILSGVHDLDADASGTLLVAARGIPGIVTVDPVTGSQALLSSGGNLVDPVGIRVDRATGEIFVVDRTADLLLRVDPGTGAQTIVASGGALRSPRQLDLDGNGDFVVANGTGGPDERGQVVRIDRSTNQQTVVSSAGLFREPNGIVVLSTVPLAAPALGTPSVALLALLLASAPLAASRSAARKRRRGRR